MIGLPSQRYIPSFIAIGPLVLEKKIFEGLLVFTIYGHGGHLGHETQIGQKYMADEKLLKEHFYKTFVQISAIAWL